MSTRDATYSFEEVTVPGLPVRGTEFSHACLQIHERGDVTIRTGLDEPVPFIDEEEREQTAQRTLVEMLEQNFGWELAPLTLTLFARNAAPVVFALPRLAPNGPAPAAQERAAALAHIQGDIAQQIDFHFLAKYAA